MKKSFVSLLTIAAITFGMVSCNSSKKQDAAEQKVEEEASQEKYLKVCLLPS